MQYTGEPTNEFSLINAGQLSALVDTLPTNMKNGNGSYSIVGGPNSIADYKCDFTFGEGLSNTFEHQTVFGRYNDTSNWGDNRPLFMIGNGTDTDHRSNAFEVRNDGLVVVGNKVQQMPDKVNDGIDFKDKNANAATLDADIKKWNEGIEKVSYGATGEFASAFGGKCAAIGKRSHAEGTTTIAKGDYSHAEGNSTVTLAYNAHAEGLQTTAAGRASHSEGEGTIAMGQNSHAEGYQSKVADLALAAHAEGEKTLAEGSYSHAGGYDSRTVGTGAFAHGRSVVATEDYQTVFGKYNKATDSLFIVGNGTNKDTLSNAFEVYKDGTIAIKYNGKKYSLQKLLEALNAFADSALLID